MSRFLNVEMDITNQCNLRCVMCYFSDPAVSSRPRRDLPVSDFARIAAEIFPLAQRASLSVGTEPLLHRQFRDIARIAGGFGVPGLYLNTSGLLLTPAVSECLIENRFHALGISMDAATAETYHRIRVGSKFGIVIANIRALERAKRRARSEGPAVTLNFVMMRSNIGELPAFIELADALEVRNVNAIHLVPYLALGNEQEALVHDKQLCNRMLDQARRVARRFGITFCDPGDFGEDAGLIPVDLVRRSRDRGHDLRVDGRSGSRSRCPFPWNFVAIDGNGDVRPCGWWHDEPCVGNVLRQSFDEIWNGIGYRTIREEHVDGRLRGVCRRCPAAGIGSVDDELAFAARTP